MAAGSEIKEIQARKHQLLLRAEHLRGQFSQACADLSRPAQAAEKVFDWVRYWRPVWPYVAPVLGFLIVRKWRWFFPKRRQKPLAWRLVRPFIRLVFR